MSKPPVDRGSHVGHLFPCIPKINASKSDRLPAYGQLHGSRDIIVDYLQGLESAMGQRFDREAQTLLGRDPFQRENWEPLLFSRFVEAFEVTANQRGAERWQWSGLRDQSSPTRVQRMQASA